MHDRLKKSNQVELLEMIKTKTQSSIVFPKDTSQELQDLILGINIFLFFLTKLI